MPTNFLLSEIHSKITNIDAQHSLSWSALVAAGTDTFNCLSSTNPEESDFLPQRVTYRHSNEISLPDHIQEQEHIHITQLAPDRKIHKAWLVCKHRGTAPQIEKPDIERLDRLQQEWRRATAFHRYTSAHTYGSRQNAIDYLTSLIKQISGASAVRIYTVRKEQKNSARFILSHCSRKSDSEHLPISCDEKGTLVGSCYNKKKTIYIPNAPLQSSKTRLRLDARVLSAGDTQREIVAAAFVPGAHDSSLVAVPIQLHEQAIHSIAILSTEEAHGFDDTTLHPLLELLNPLFTTIARSLAPHQQRQAIEKLTTELSARAETAQDYFQGLAQALSEAFGTRIKLSTTQNSQPLAVSKHKSEALQRHEALKLTLKTEQEESITADLQFFSTLAIFDTKSLTSATNDQLASYTTQFLSIRQSDIADTLAELFDKHRRNHQSFYQSALQSLTKFVKGHIYLLETLSNGPAATVATTRGSPELSANEFKEIKSTIRNTTSPSQVSLTPDRIVAVGPKDYQSTFSVIVRRSGERPFTSIDRSLVESFCRYLLTHARAFRAILDRDAVIQIVPHDLSLPISIINDRYFGLRDIIAKTKEGQAIDALADIQVANKLNRLLVDNMLIATGTDAFRNKLTPIRFKADILEPVVSMAKLQATNRNLSSESITIHPSCYLDEFKGTKEELMLIFHNILSNAVKYYTGSRSDFELKLEAHNDQIRPGTWITIEDNGMGVPDGWENHIFERGKRAPNAVQTEPLGGLGLGLFTASQVAKRFDGEIELSCPRRPTRFRVYIPNTRSRS